MTQDTSLPVAPPAPQVGRRRWRRSTRIGAALWVVLVLVQVAAVVGYYLVYDAPYVTTLNAQVDGHQVQVNAPANGVLVRWDVGPGTVVRAGQPIGRIRLDGVGFSRPERVVRAPGSGRVAMVLAQEGQWVSQGTTLALGFGDDGVYVTARVPTTRIAQVHVGAPVDLTVSADTATTVAGVVSEIQASTAGELDIYPSPDQNTQNPQRVKQWVPVKITFADPSGVRMLPGVNVTARIHRS